MVRSEPTCAPAFFYAGQIRLAIGELDATRAALREAVRLAPQERDYAKALRELGA